MNQYKKYLFVVFGVNTLLFCTGFLDPMLFLVFWGSLIGELFVGLVMLFTNSSKQRGLGLITAVGISLLVGFSVCSSLNWNI